MLKKGLQIDELNLLLKKWVKKFQLESWDINIKITDFERKDFKQSGDIKIDFKNKKATLLLTNKPFRNEESTIIHELIHLLLWDYDTFSEKVILKNCEKFNGNHSKYMKKLEKTVANLTDIFLNQKN
jgi:hypothetical protein